MLSDSASFFKSFFWVNRSKLRLKDGDMSFTTPPAEGGWQRQPKQLQSVSIHHQPQMAVPKQPAASHKKSKRREPVWYQAGRRNRHKQCYVFFTNVEESGNNIAHCTAWEVLFSAAHCSWVMSWDWHWWHQLCVWRIISSLERNVPVEKIILAPFGHVVRVNE